MYQSPMSMPWTKKRSIFGSFAHFLLEFLRFEVSQSSMDIMAVSAGNMAASVTLLRGQINWKNRNSFKIDLKHSRFSIVLHNFCTKFCLLRIPWPPRMFKEAAIMSSEVMAFSKSKNSCKNRTKPPKISRIFVAAIDCFIYTLQFGFTSKKFP